MLRYLVLLCIFSVIKLEKCCSNQNDEILNCNRLKLQLIPNCVNQKHIKKFVLSFNKIINLRNHSFSMYYRLTELRLDNNKMKVIQVDALKGLSNLKSLNLHNNLLEYLAPSLLSGLSNLQYIKLNNNKFIKIPEISNSALNHLYLGNNQIRSFNFPLSYLNCTNLRRIDLKNNQAKNLNKSNFYHLKNSQVESLFMQNNKITNVSTEIFFFIRKRLRSFYIDHNPSISDYGFQKILDSFDHFRHKKSWHLDIFASNVGLRILTNFTFSSLQHVSSRILDLSENSIEILPTEFNKVQSLLELYLNDNKLKIIKNNQFENMKKLTFLNLSHNLINLIESYGFAGLKSLETLDLSFNQIKVLNLLILNPLSDLKELFITGNKIIVLNSCINRGISQLAYSDWSTNGIIQLNSQTKSVCFSDSKCDYIPKHNISFHFELDIDVIICLAKYNDTIENETTRHHDSQSKLSFLTHKQENNNKVLIIIITFVCVILIGSVVTFGVLMIRRKYLPVKSPKKKQFVKTENFYESIDSEDFVEKI